MQRSFLTYMVSVLGLPAISIPCGFTRDGLPVGLQIVGKRRAEAPSSAPPPPSSPRAPGPIACPQSIER